MPGKKKKFNARFPPARIKKIMQTDEDVGKVAAAVPVIISRALELFVDRLLQKANDVATRRGAKTLTPSHLKLCINSEARFDFLKGLTSNVADLQGDMDLDQAAAATTTTTTTEAGTSDKTAAAPSPSSNPSTFVGASAPSQTASAPSPLASRRASSVQAGPSTSTGRKRGRPRKHPIAAAEELLLRKRGRPRKHPIAAAEEPLLRKRGRPRKHPIAAAAAAPAAAARSPQKPKKKKARTGRSEPSSEAPPPPEDQYYAQAARFVIPPPPKSGGDDDDDTEALARAKNVGMVCDEDEEEYNNVAAVQTQKPNGVSGFQPFRTVSPAAAAAPRRNGCHSTALADSDDKTGCEKVQGSGGDLVVDEDYDC